MKSNKYIALILLLFVTSCNNEKDLVITDDKSITESGLSEDSIENVSDSAVLSGHNLDVDEIIQREVSTYYSNRKTILYATAIGA